MFEWIGLLIAPITGVVSYVVGKGQRNNEFLNQLQGSINMLVDENTKLLEENVKLRVTVAALQVAQNDLMNELSELRKELKRQNQCGHTSSP